MTTLLRVWPVRDGRVVFGNQKAGLGAGNHLALVGQQSDCSKTAHHGGAVDEHDSLNAGLLCHC